MTFQAFKSHGPCKWGVKCFAGGSLVAVHEFETKSERKAFMKAAS